MFIDTSGFFCLIHRDEPEHDDAVQIFDGARDRCTNNYVLDEFVSLAHARKLPRSRALEFSKRILADQSIEVIWVDEPMHRLALDPLEQRLDKTYSLCDAVSFIVMRELGVIDAMTTDAHFEQEGFVRLLK